MNVHYGSDVGCEAYEVSARRLNRPGATTGSFGIMRMECLSGVVALGSRKPAVVEIGEVDRRAGALAGVRRTTAAGLAQWRYHGRLVARELDETHLVIRADFEYRDTIVRQFPGTFSVPARYGKHMMVVADLERGDAGAIEDALEAAWELQRSAET